VRNSEPDCRGSLRADSVHAKRREEADDTSRHTRARQGERKILRWFYISPAVEAAALAHDLAGADERRELVGRESGGLELARSEESTELGKGSRLRSGPLALARFVGIPLRHSRNIRMQRW
jgi:hypothetical protein